MKILVATDGSTFGNRALEKACDFSAGAKDVAYKVVSVYEPPIPTAAEPYAMSLEYYQHLDEVAKRQAENAVQKAVDAIRDKFPDPSVEITMIVRLGNPAQIIVEEAENWASDLVVVGSHGYGFWGRLAVGSVSDAVVHHAPCSILVVKSQAEKG
ncbi:MAG: universal stress protein [Acidobacteriota bacterium]